MATRDKLRGTTETLFQIGIKGHQIKYNGGSPGIEARDKDDAAYCVVRGAPPVADNDFVTKKHFDDNNSSNLNIACAEITVGTSSIAPTTGSLPANATVTEVRLVIDTPYSAGATISVALTAGATLMATGDNDAEESAGEIFTVKQDNAVGGASKTIDVTVGGAPGAGAARVQIYYVTSSDIT